MNALLFIVRYWRTIAIIAVPLAMVLAAYAHGRSVANQTCRENARKQAKEAQDALNRANTAWRDAMASRAVSDALNAKELKDAAKLGTNAPVGPGVGAVLDRVRQQQRDTLCDPAARGAGPVPSRAGCAR